MPKPIDMVGYKTGLITVIERVGSSKGQTTWLCQCACGKKFIQYGGPLRKGKVKSCGHIWKSRSERQKIAYNSIAKKKHGGCADRLYFIWIAMRHRCYYEKDISYKNYGGRGIVVCDEWRNDYGAFKEWSIKSGYNEDAPRGACTLDRIDPDGNYCPENCKWTSMKDQSNNRRNSYTITWNNETHTAKEWEVITGIPREVIYSRHRAGWSADRILSKNKYGPHGEIVESYN